MADSAARTADRPCRTTLKSFPSTLKLLLLHIPHQVHIMAEYDSDSSLEDASEYTETGVLLGYATKESTDDTISRLGGHPVSTANSAPLQTRL
jgi:hypothetical protein